MATISIADNDARVQYTQAVNGLDNDPSPAATELTIDFPFFNLDDINVIKTTAAGVDTVLSRGTGTGTFTVTGTSVDDGFSGGNVKLHDTDVATDTTYTIFRDIDVTRTTDFPTSGPFNVSSLNTELDRIIAIEQELETKITRTLRLAESDATADVSLPNLDTRKGKTLAFNATTGAVEAGPSVAGVTTVSALSADIATLADIEDGTVATNAISDTAAIKTNVTTVAGISSNVSTVAGISSDVTAVAADATDIGTVSTNIANVNTVAGISSDVTTVSGISSDVTAVAADATDIGTVSSNIANVNTVAGISADVTTVAADGTDIGVVAGLSSNITTVSGISANVTTVAGISANVTAVAGDATDIGTVATSIANVNTVAGISSDVTTVAGISSDVTAAATNVSDIQAISAAIADVITVANDLNEATSEIDVVANNIANVNAVGTGIANVNTVASNLTNVNAFADTYFISSTAPASPTLGDLWFDTAANTMKVYGSSGFQNAGSSVNGTAERVSYTATAGQTSFAATYDAGFVDVYLNGIKLIDGTDFTATNGTSIVLSSGAALNDTVDIVGYGTFQLVNLSINDATDVNTSGVTNGQVLTYNSTSGDFEPQTPSAGGISDVVSDTTPQLGGSLDAQSNNITSVGLLGVGTASPSEKIHSTGAIISTGSATTAVASSSTIDFNSGQTRIISRGADTSTNGGFTFRAERSNGSNAADVVISGDGVLASTRGIVQVVTSTPNTHASGNPINTWAEINSNYRVAITPKYSNSRILGTFHIPINPTGAANILFAFAPWYSTNGGTTKVIIANGASLGSRHTLSAAWTRSANGHDGNDMQNHVIHFHHDPGTTGAVTYGYYFRSEGSNTTYFNHSLGNNNNWGWTGAHYMELRELKV